LKLTVTVAQILDDALKEEFRDEAEQQDNVGKQFNETVSKEEGKQETVVRITQKKEKDDEDEGEHTSQGTKKDLDIKNGNEKDTSNEEKHLDMAVESDVDRIIDSHDNEYVLSKPNTEGSLGLTLDPQLIRDMSLLIVFSAAAGQLMAAIGQPTINGYFLAGSLMGQGGFGLAKEIVQLQSISQLGVQFLLFTLGLELNLSKLKAVRNVALFGGLLEVALMSLMGALVAFIIGAGAYHGAFIGALLAMSSTSIVVKCIQEGRAAHQPHAQITIGTLVLQDCVVGLIFAFMPVLASASSSGHGSFTIGEILQTIGKVFGTLTIAIILTVLFAALAASHFVKYLKKSSSETFQLSILGFGLAIALITTKLGISAELGAFMAGAALSSTEYQEFTLHAIEPTSNLFLALFVSSTGLTIPPAFLGEHILVLASGVALIIAAKTLLVASVVLLFGFPPHTALGVGINLAQVGEFGFVLLSIASRYGMIPHEVSLLLIGITALSLLMTPFLMQISLKVISKMSKSRFEDADRAPLVVTNGSPPGYYE
jgi:Kef-type K+ transport system membrane component KefB